MGFCLSVTGPCRDCMDAAVDKEKAAERAREQEAQEEIRQKQFRRERQEQAQRIRRRIEELGLADECELPPTYSWFKDTSAKEIERIAEGRFDDDHYYDGLFLPKFTAFLVKWAEFLECSTDYLLGRTDVPTVAIEAPQVSGSDSKPKWQTGTPTEVGTYVVRFGMSPSEMPEACAMNFKHWNGIQWTNLNGVPLHDDMNVYRWLKLPEV